MLQLFKKLFDKPQAKCQKRKLTRLEIKILLKRRKALRNKKIN